MHYSRNEYIKASKVLVIDNDGTQLGIMPTIEAIKIAKQKELDLIEVAPNANPPVVRIYSWSKFKYQQDKKRKDNKGKTVEQKEMWFKAFIDKGDLDHKIKKVREFLNKKHPVKITIRAKGRVTKEKMNELLNKILTELAEEIKYDGQPKLSGRNLSIIITPNSTTK